MRISTIAVIIISASLILDFSIKISSGVEGSEKSGDKQDAEIVTPAGNVYVGMSESKLYEIFPEKYRLLIPHRILSKEWVVFQDWISTNPHDVITFYINAGYVTGWKRGYDSAPLNKGSIYEYNTDEKIDRWFFPAGQARWDGSKLNLLDWNKLEQIQKIMFITEYLEDINMRFNTNITIDIDRYVLGMNYFTDNCPESCRNISAADAVNNLLISDGKAKEAPPEV